MNYQLLTGSNLAYIGDAYYELYIRKYLLEKNITKSKELRKISINYVSAHAHALIYAQLKEELNDEEQQIFLRGRNSAPKGFRKNVDRYEYLISSGYEAIIGYLYLKGNLDRLHYLIKKSIAIVESKYENIW